MSFKSQRSKATNFSKEVKIDMLRRDGYRCIFCKSSTGLTPAHFISRGAGGMGIVENGACVCVECHMLLDQSINRKDMLKEFRVYLDFHYPEFTDDDRVFNRRKWLK